MFKALDTKPEDHIYRIGKSLRGLKRLSEHASGVANDIEPLFLMPVEVHCKEFQYRRTKEIYDMELDLLKKIITRCKDINKIIISDIKDFTDSIEISKIETTNLIDTLSINTKVSHSEGTLFF